MDFVTSLPQSRGFTTIMVVVDRLTKYAHFAPLPPHFNALRVANLFYRDSGKASWVSEDFGLGQGLGVLKRRVGGDAAFEWHEAAFHDRIPSSI